MIPNGADADRPDCVWNDLPPPHISLEYNASLDLSAEVTTDDATSSDSYLGSSSSDSDMAEEELGEFLWDAFAGYDPSLEDLAELCT